MHNDFVRCSFINDGSERNKMKFVYIPQFYCHCTKSPIEISVHCIYRLIIRVFMILVSTMIHCMVFFPNRFTSLHNNSHAHLSNNIAMHEDKFYLWVIVVLERVFLDTESNSIIVNLQMLIHASNATWPPCSFISFSGIVPMFTYIDLVYP